MDDTGARPPGPRHVGPVLPRAMHGIGMALRMALPDGRREGANDRWLGGAGAAAA